VPGVDSEDNVAIAKKSIDRYQATLQCDPRSVNSMKAIAFLNMQMRKFEEAKQGYREALKFDDKDPELYYSVAVIDWTEAYGNSMKVKTRMDAGTAEAGKKTADQDEDNETSDSDDQQAAEEPLSLDPACPDLRARNMAAVEDGIQMLTRAMELRKDYDDAMAYMNLLYRERANIECGNSAAVAADLKKANDWSDLAMQARKRKAEAEDEAAKKCESEKGLKPECMSSQEK
jgi:tetratricopeptide (TPR) repeat protein